MINRWFGWKTFNDRLALLVLVLIPCLWVVNHWLIMPGEVIGATIMAWGLVLQFYFRRREPNDTPPTEPAQPSPL